MKTNTNTWTKNIPSVEGHYLWKRAKNSSPFRYQHCFVEIYNEGMSRDFWQDLTCVNAPKGGWWQKIEYGDEYEEE